MIDYCADVVETGKQCAEARGAEKLEQSLTDIQEKELIHLLFLAKRDHLVPERQLKKLVFGLQLGDEVVDDDEVEGEEGAAADVDDLEAGEGEEGQLVHLGGRELQPQQKDNEKNLGLIGAAHEEHLLLQTYKL